MVIIRTLAVWIILIAVEILHGIVRGIFLVPRVGKFRSSQIGVFTGSLIILAIALAFVRWISAIRPVHLLGIGILWLCLTLAFEFLFGRFVVGASWERLPRRLQRPSGRVTAVRHGRAHALAAACREAAGIGVTSCRRGQP
jgi:hypothetical protein